MYVHQAVFHIFPWFGDQMYTIDKHLFKQRLAYIPLVSEQFAEQPFVEVFVFQGLPVIGIAGREQEIDQLAFVIYNDMQFEAIEPAN